MGRGFIQLKYSLPVSPQEGHDALTVSDSLGSTRLDPYWFDAGTGAYESISHVPPFWSGRSDQFSNAFQLDVDGSGTAHDVRGQDEADVRAVEGRIAPLVPGAPGGFDRLGIERSVRSLLPYAWPSNIASVSTVAGPFSLQRAYWPG